MAKYTIYAYPIWAPVPEQITIKDFPNDKAANDYAYKCAKTVYEKCASDKIVDPVESVREKFFLNNPEANETAYFKHLRSVIDEWIKYYAMEKEYNDKI